jgi:hypothetical protein
MVYCFAMPGGWFSFRLFAMLLFDTFFAHLLFFTCIPCFYSISVFILVFPLLFALISEVTLIDHGVVILPTIYCG